MDGKAMEELLVDVEPIIAAMGCQVVEMTSHRTAEGINVSLVLYRSDGITLDDCAAISQTLHPQLEMICQDEVILEVASPGVDRRIRNPDEFSVFKGKGVRVLVDETGEWQTGIIDHCSDGFLFLLNNKRYDKIPLSNIRKARLDYAQEVAQRNGH